MGIIDLLSYDLA